jgi:hypothetical protein
MPRVRWRSPSASTSARARATADVVSVKKRYRLVEYRDLRRGTYVLAKMAERLCGQADWLDFGLGMRSTSGTSATRAGRRTTSSSSRGGLDRSRST